MPRLGRRAAAARRPVRSRPHMTLVLMLVLVTDSCLILVFLLPLSLLLIMTMMEMVAILLLVRIGVVQERQVAMRPQPLRFFWRLQRWRQRQRPRRIDANTDRQPDRTSEEN